MRSNADKLIKACVFVYFIMLILTLSHVFFYTDMQEFMRADKEAANRDYSRDWILDSGETIKIDAITAGGLGGRIAASKTLPAKMHETDSIYFSTSNLNFIVYDPPSEIVSTDAPDVTGFPLTDSKASQSSSSTPSALPSKTA